MAATRRRQGRGGAAVLGAAALCGLALAAWAAPRTLLVTEVTWIDSAQQTGVLLFQGEVADGVLTGQVYPVAGDAEALVVTGTVSAAGAVVGTLATVALEPVGDFTGTLNAEQELEGGLVIDGELSAAWVAPAPALAAVE